VSDEPPIVEPGTADAVIIGDEDLEGKGQRDGTGPPDGGIGIRKMRGEECPFERKVIGPEDTIEVGNTIEIRNLEDSETVVQASKVTEVGTMIGDVDTEFHKVKTESGGDKWYEAEAYALVKIGEKLIPEAKGMPATGSPHIQEGWWYDEEGLRWRVTDSTTDLLTIKSIKGRTDKILLKDFIKKYSRREDESKIGVGASIKFTKNIDGTDTVEGKVAKIEETGITVALDDGTTVMIEDPTAVNITVTAPAPAEEIEPIEPPEEEVEDMEAAGPLPIEDDVPEEEFESKKTSEAKLPTEGGVSEEIAAGNLLRDKDGNDWVVKNVGDGGLTVTQPGEPRTEKRIEWVDVEGYGFTKISESKVDEDSSLKATLLRRVKSLEKEKANFEKENQRKLDQVEKELKALEVEGSGLKKESKVEEATSVEKDDGWHVVSPSGADLGGPYGSKFEADKRKKDVEFYAASKESKVDESDESKEEVIIQLVKYYKGLDDEVEKKAVIRTLKWLGYDTDKLTGVDESKVDETADIKAMYKAADLPAPDGKGIHTKAFHELVINVAKGYVDSGDTSKDALKKAYPTAMKQLGKEKAVKKPHQKSEAKVEEDFEEFEGKGIEVGDTVQIMDLEGNTTPVPKATVHAIDEALGDDGEMHLTIETTGSENEDEQEWYREDQYQIILLRKVGESISTAAKEIKDLKIEEASIRAERDKAIELLEEITNEKVQLAEQVRKEKAFEIKVLINKIEKTLEGKEREVNALRTMLEKKVKLAADVEKRLSEAQTDLSVVEQKHQIEADALMEHLEKTTNTHIDQITAFGDQRKVEEDKHQKEADKLVESHKVKIEEVKENIRKEVQEEVRKEFVTSFIRFRLSETGQTIDENSQALLEKCTSLEEVDDFLDEIMEVSRRSALHSESITGVHIGKREVVDPETEKVKRMVGGVFEGMNN
jgi:hypothetical protein